MVDIYGRSRITREKKSDVDMKDIIKKIKDEISGLINIKDVDEKEIVIFETDHGKLKTSNVSLDDLLMKDPTADDDSVAVFQKGKLAPSVIISSINEKLEQFEQFLSDFLGGPRQPVIQVAYIKTAIDNLIKLRTEYDVHIGQFSTLRRNFSIVDTVIEKFFGKKNPTVDNVKILQSEIIDFRQKTVNDIDSLTQTVSNIRESVKKSIDDGEVLKKLIEDFKVDIVKIIKIITEKTDKIKIAFPESHIRQIVQVVYTETFDFNVTQNTLVATLSFYKLLLDNAEISGIYRVSVIAYKEININVRTGTGTGTGIGTDTGTGILLGHGVDYVVFVALNTNFIVEMSPVDTKDDNFKCTIVLEYLGRY